jgi:hypothetical protein
MPTVTIRDGAAAARWRVIEEMDPAVGLGFCSATPSLIIR